MFRIVFRLARAALVFAVIAALVRKAVKTPVMAGLGARRQGEMGDQGQAANG